METLMKRYNENEQRVIKEFFDKCARTTRKRGKMSENIKKKQLIDWQKYDKRAVMEGLRIYNTMTLKEDQGERYAWGIIKNKDKVLKEKELKANAKNIRADKGTAEGERIAELAGKYATSGEAVECDF